MSHSPEQSRKKAEAMADANKNLNVVGESPKSKSYFDLPGYNENDERGKIDREFEKNRPAHEAQKKKYGLVD